MITKRSLLVGMTLLLAACTSAEPHQDFGFALPKLWSRMPAADKAADAAPQPIALDANAAIEQQWWTHFNDPSLNKLVASALAGNKTLAIAKFRVAEARANRKASIAALFPQISGSADAVRENEGFLFNQPIGLADANIQASWELDLFGENQARAAAAQAIVQSTDDDRRGSTVTLLSDVARNYFDYRNAERQVEITEQNLTEQQKTLDVTKAQFQGGELSNLDVERATAQVLATESELPNLRTQRDSALNALSILTGAPPGTVDADLKGLPPLAPLDAQTIVSAPANVIANRPDVGAAERQFAATLSLKKAATRALFPSVPLTALYGVQDTTVLIARPWTLALGLTQPLLNFGALTSQIDATNARQQQAFLNYQQTVLQALGDMENALSSYGHEAERNAILHANVDAATKAEALARQQFTGGEIGLLDLLIAERDTLSAESSLAASDSLLRQDLVHIYAAAGGGWQVSENAPEEKISPQVP